MTSHLEERNHDHTIHVSGLDKNVNEALLWELMIQAGPVVSVYIPRDKLTKDHSGYGFVEFQSEADVQYALKIMEEVPLFNKKIYINLSGRDKKTFDIGANLYIGHIDPSVDDRQLTETFQAFGTLIGPSKIIRDELTGQSKGYAFVYYDSFEASDAAISAMNDQFFGNERIIVTYAYKKDKPGERHGDPAERLLASKNPVLKHRKELQQMSQAFASKTNNSITSTTMPTTPTAMRTNEILNQSNTNYNMPLQNNSGLGTNSSHAHGSSFMPNVVAPMPANNYYNSAPIHNPNMPMDIMMNSNQVYGHGMIAPNHYYNPTQGAIPHTTMNPADIKNHPYTYPPPQGAIYNYPSTTTATSDMQ